MTRSLALGLILLLLHACGGLPATRNPLATWVPSPNRDERRPVLIVLHATEQQSLQQSLDTLRTANDHGRVSAHYLIGRDGTRYQLVEDELRAWHAGAGRWGSITNVNAASIGIELENDGAADYPDAQLDSLIALLGDLCQRWSIPRTQVIAHADMAPARKVDPGPQFPWQRLHAAGFGIWPADDAPPAPPGFDPWRALAQIGYPLADRAMAVRAFKLRFRGQRSQALDAEDLRILHALTEPEGAPPRRRHAAGTTLHYLRSNQDGTLPERVLVHVVDDRHLAVAKMVARCQPAALVTAQVDPVSGEALRLTGGRLTPTGAQQAQAILALEPAGRTLLLRGADADSPVLEQLPAPAAPWRQYDFDLAEFALAGPREPTSFSAGMVMAWPGDSPLLRALGAWQFEFVASEQSGTVHRFQLRDLDTAVSGELTVDAAFGHVLEARFSAPNHPGYRDFRLQLQQVVPGEEAWQQSLAAHWANCPAPSTPR